MCVCSNWLSDMPSDGGHSDSSLRYSTESAWRESWRRCWSRRPSTHAHNMLAIIDLPTFDNRVWCLAMLLMKQKSWCPCHWFLLKNCSKSWVNAEEVAASHGLSLTAKARYWLAYADSYYCICTVRWLCSTKEKETCTYRCVCIRLLSQQCTRKVSHLMNKGRN